MDLANSFHCPSCQADMAVDPRSVGPGTVLTCAKCGTEIKLQGADLRHMQRTIDDFMRTMSSFGRRR